MEGVNHVWGGKIKVKFVSECMNKLWNEHKVWTYKQKQKNH